MPPSLPPTGPPSGATSAQASRLVAPIPAGGGPDGTRQMPAVTPDTAMAPQAREQRARTATRQAPTRRLQPGDLVCGDCGEGNPPNRKFCSRCGTSLETATAVKTPWWRKLLPKRKAKVLDAGARPGRGGVRARSRRAAALAKVLPTIRKVIAVVVLLSGLVYGAYAPFRGWTNDKVVAGKNKITRLINPKYDPVHPTKVGATTTQIKTHESSRAIDGFGNTYWLSQTPLAGGKNVQAALILWFPTKVDLDRALFTIGVRDKFTSTNRPQKVHIVYDTGATFDLTLTDTPKPQEVKLGKGHGITSMRIFITSYFRAESSTEVAITELELFHKE
jgi:hypothetical protein